LQTTTTADEVVPVVPPADPSQRSHLSSLQGQVQVQEPQEAKEEGIKEKYRVSKIRF